jgi:hypothetical protein
VQDGGIVVFFQFLLFFAYWNCPNKYEGGIFNKTSLTAVAKTFAFLAGST